MNTGIRIEANREVSDKGERGYRITKIQALLQKELPQMYLESDKEVVFTNTKGQENTTYLFLRLNKEIIYIDGWDGVRSGDFYTIETMKKINAYVKAAGDHLMQVNAHLRKEREAWNGPAVFVDGEEVISKESVRPWEPWLQAKEALLEDKQPPGLYKITDGSWNLCSTKAGMKHIAGLRFENNKYRIVDQGLDLPSYRPAHLCKFQVQKRNDTIVQNVNTGQIVFTCKRFLQQI